jgi:hypothetical protein
MRLVVSKHLRLEKWSQEDYKFQVSLGYMGRSCLKKENSKQKKLKTII